MDPGPQDFMGSFYRTNENGLQNLVNQNSAPYPIVDSVKNLASSSSSSFSCTAYLPQYIMQSVLSAETQRQNMEMDWFLQQESNRLRRAIMQEEARQMAITMQVCESRMQSLMLQKDEELAIARNRTMELQLILEASEIERVMWQKTAREFNDTAVELSHMLDLVMEGVGNTASSCDPSTSGERKRNCKVCQARVSNVVIFPCRHLCCCRYCEPSVVHCPVCQVVKESMLIASLV